MNRIHFSVSRSHKVIITTHAILLGLMVFALVIPVGAQAIQLSDLTPTPESPTASATETASLPPTPVKEYTWLSFPGDSSSLASDRSLDLLAGKFIHHGLVDASSCADGGMLKSGAASSCGESVAHNAVIVWQNQFDAEILRVAQESGIPPFILKNVFIKESQFWPETYHNPTYGGEYSLGHLTTMGVDTILRWNRPYYKKVCNQNFNEETCSKEYVFQDPAIQDGLKGVIITSINADCSTCLGGVDLEKARASISVTAAMLVANRNHVQWLVNGFSSSKDLNKENTWRFTLASYNAGPGCFTEAFYGTRGNGNPLSWKDVSQRFSGVCKRAINYVAFMEEIDTADPAALILASSDTSRAARMVLGPLATPTTISPSTPLNTSTVIATETPTASSLTDIPVTETPTTFSLTGTPVTEIPTTSSTTGTPVTETPTASSLTGTPVNASETPTASTLAATATPTATSLTGITPVVLETATPTQIMVPAPTEAVQTVNEQLQSPHVQDQVVLKIDPQNSGNVLQTLSALGISPVVGSTEIDSLDTLVIQVPSDQLNTVLNTLQASEGVEFAEPNYLVQLSSLPNDPFLAQQTGLWVMQVPQTWDALPSMQEVLVAVIDTGVDFNHPDLSDAIWQNVGETGLDSNGADKRFNDLDDDYNGYVDDWRGWNMVSANNNPNDDQGHGSRLAGVIGARMNNSIGIAGIAPNARILPVKTLDNTGYGSYTQVAEGIVYATDMGARIINLGFGGAGSSELLQNAIDYAVARGVLVIAAAGNGGVNTTYYPAAYPGVIAVGSVDNDLTWSPFSSSGTHISLVAPGVGVYSTLPGASYSATSGTSISSAQVSGVAALLAGQPQFNNLNILRSALLNSAHDLGSLGQDPYYGYGVVRAFDALAYAGPILPTPTPWIVPTSTPGGSGGVYSMSFQDLWATAQIYSFTTTNPANSIDSAFNDLLAFNTGLWGGATRNWTFTTIDDTTLTAVAKVDLELRFYMTGWVNDTYYIQVFDNTNPACIGGWCTVYNLKFIPTSPIEGQPPSVLTTLTVPVTSILNTVARVNAAQVRIAGSGVTGGFTDTVTIYIDEVRLHMLDVLPPTATPTSTAIFIPTSTLPAARAITATPLAVEPHNNFMSATTDECATCHRSHTAKSMGLRNLTGEEQVCFSCHTSGGTATNVQPAFTLKSNTATRFFSHGVSSTVNVHNSSENNGGDFGTSKRHVECEDCHSPHSSARTASGLVVAAPAAQQEIFDSSGIDPQWTVAGAPTSFTWMTTAEREYQVCFKCHSSFVATLPTYAPDGYNGDISAYVLNGLAKLTSANPAQVRDSRDLAQEFNSYQVSFHPVAAVGRNRNMPAGSFVVDANNWSQDSILYCTDCHDNASAPTNGSGPHGSPLLHLLDGSSEYITKTDPAKSCAPGGCPSIHTTGELCFKCHQYNTYATGLNPSTTTRFKTSTGENLHAFHGFGACYTCHDTHGSEQDRLINFDTSVVSVSGNSQSAWEFNAATNTGTCYVACHDGDHGLDPSRQYSP